jgi:regulatory subunit for Cdc7p protein kinase
LHADLLAGSTTRLPAPKNGVSKFGISTVRDLPFICSHILTYSITELESVLDRVLARPTTQPPRRTPNLTLTHLLATEKAAGATLERDPRERRHDYTYFKKGSYFLLIEDITGEHQPIGRMEFNPPRPGAAIEWPVLHLDPRMRNPFQEYSPKTAGKERVFEKREESSRLQRVASIRELRALKRRDDLRRTASLNNLRTAADLEDLHANTTTTATTTATNARELSLLFRQETDMAGERMASGYLVSGNSTALPTTETSLLSTSVSLSRLTGGLRHARPQVTMNRRAGDLRRVKSAMNLRGEVTNVEKEKKSGYCECCRITFEDYVEVCRCSSSLVAMLTSCMTSSTSFRRNTAGSLRIPDTGANLIPSFPALQDL